jgi:hypothetical protein
LLRRVDGLLEASQRGGVLGVGCFGNVRPCRAQLGLSCCLERDRLPDQFWPVFLGDAVSVQAGVDLEVQFRAVAGAADRDGAQLGDVGDPEFDAGVDGGAVVIVGGQQPGEERHLLADAGPAQLQSCRDLEHPDPRDPLADCGPRDGQ